MNIAGHRCFCFGEKSFQLSCMQSTTVSLKIEGQGLVGGDGVWHVRGTLAEGQVPVDENKWWVSVSI